MIHCNVPVPTENASAMVGNATLRIVMSNPIVSAAATIPPSAHHRLLSPPAKAHLQNPAQQYIT